MRLDPDEFPALFAAHRRRLLAYFMRRTFDAEASLDLVGETFAQAFTSRRGFRGRTDEEAAAYLFGIAAHLLSRYFRKGVAERRAMQRIGVPRPALDDESLARIEELAGVGEMRALVREQLAALSPEQRDALRLRVVQELPYSEVAARLGIEEATARARVSRGLRALQRGLEAAA